MSNRIVRINELVAREISDILRRRHASEAVAITILEVRVAPDLRDGRVFVSIVGDDETVRERFGWLQRMAPEIREELAKRIVLKFLPHFTYVLDKSSEKVARVLSMLDQLERKGATQAEAKDGEVLS